VPLLEDVLQRLEIQEWKIAVSLLMKVALVAPKQFIMAMIEEVSSFMLELNN